MVFLIMKMKQQSMGLDFSGFSTQAAFFDYDLDGDLDFFLMNHSLRFNGTFNERLSYLNTFDTLSADYLFRNESPSGGGKGEVNLLMCLHQLALTGQLSVMA